VGPSNPFYHIPTIANNNSPLVDKQELCCEYIGQKEHGTRDRLEIRVRRDEKRNFAFSALKRDQFASGYENEVDKKSLKLIRSYFGDEVLVQAHTALEKVGNSLLAFLCRFIGYSHHDDLSARLNDEKDTPGVLRLMRYMNKPPTAATTSELAIDHTDIGLITLMPHSDAESLQILSQEYDWIDVEKGQASDTLVAIVGEQLAYLSNYTFQAVRHRVIPTHSHATRYSLPFLMRAPADYEVIQAKTRKHRFAKDILNHIFDMPDPLRERIQCALKLVKQYEQASMRSKRKTRLVASSISLPSPTASYATKWPMILFFDRGKPSSTTHRRFSSDASAISPISHFSGELINTSNFIRWKDHGWRFEEWPTTISAFECQFEDMEWLVFVVPIYMENSTDDVDTDDGKYLSTCVDLAYSVKSSNVIHGRDVLEKIFEINRHRIY
jgi:hypothetical protein